LHAYAVDKKVKLASSEFDGYPLCWWDNITRQRQAAREVPVQYWREMKEIMHARFVPTNYLCLVFDRLTQLKQGFLTVDAYYKMELLMQRSRVQESIQMTMQWFSRGLGLPTKNIIMHHTYNDLNQLLHHAMKAEAQLAEEAQQKS
jgi:hypothetical protein